MLLRMRSPRKNKQNVRLKLDEGLSYRLKPKLQELGHNVDTVIDEGLRATDDSVLADIAHQDDRMLFTLDRGLGDIRQYAPGGHPGIVVFRLSFVGPGAMSRFVEDFVRNQNLDQLTGCLVIVEPGNVRIRRE